MEHATTFAIQNPSHRFGRPLQIKRASVSIDSVDLISDLPEEILHHIFSFIPTKFAIRTSVLSKRWRNVWSETPHVSFECPTVSLKSINKTLVNYSASKITSFHLCTRLASKARHVNSWIEFAMSHNVDKLSLEFRGLTNDYSFPDLFYSSSSLKQLIVDFQLSNKMIPKCTVSWTSLKNLSLYCCKLSDESFLNILSGCPILESLRLQFCDSVTYLDLSKLLRLRRLEIDRSPSFGEPMEIVAPHIYYLRLRNSEAHCTLVDVSSLTEAYVDFSYMLHRTSYNMIAPLKTDLLLAMAQTMLAKFQNVEKLTLGVNFLRILSLSWIPNFQLPELKVKNLTLETMILRSLVPGIAKLLQNSPGLKKVTVYTVEKSNTVLDTFINSYLDLQDMNPDQYCWKLKDVVFPTSWESEVVKPELMASFMELLLANAGTLETLVIRLGSTYTNRSRLEQLLHIALTLSHHKKENCVNKYLDSQDLNSNFATSWRYDYQVVGPELIASFMELLLANKRTLETLVVRLGSCIKRSRFEELFQIAGTLSHNNKVSIVLK